MSLHLPHECSAESAGPLCWKDSGIRITSDLVYCKAPQTPTPPHPHHPIPLPHPLPALPRVLLLPVGEAPAVQHSVVGQVHDRAAVAGVDEGVQRGVLHRGKRRRREAGDEQLHSLAF